MSVPQHTLPGTPSERWLPVATAALLLGGLALFAAGLERLVPPCPLHATTGILCPGCGSGRVARALLAGDLTAAWRANPLVVLALPALAYGLVREALQAWGVARLPAPRMAAWAGWAVLALIVAFWVARNIPAWPFELLAPR